MSQVAALIIAAWRDELGGKQSDRRLQGLRNRLADLQGNLGLSDQQMFELQDRVLDQVKIFPKRAHIIEAAKDLGFYERKIKARLEKRAHTWEETDCRLCRGEGRLAVYRELMARDDETGGLIREERQCRILPLSTGTPKELLEPGRIFYEYIYRCACLAGSAETIPRAWPRWQGEPTQIEPEPAEEPRHVKGFIEEGELPF